MPRVDDRLMKAVIYLYSSVEAAESGDPGGSGFLIAMPSRVPGAVMLLAVTNAHVAKSCPVLRTAGPWEDRIVPGASKDWVRHPAGDDLVVRPIGIEPLADRGFRVDWVEREWFVQPWHFVAGSIFEEDMAPVGWPFGPGDEVVMLGRFLAHDGTTENMPAARFGHLAMKMPIGVDHPWQFQQASFLVECRSV